MTTQARPDWNAEMDRQIKATESAQALVNDHERTIRDQRKVIEKYRTALEKIDRHVVGACESDFGDMPEPCESCVEMREITAAALEVKPT
jgi:hypothetical protein